MEEKKKDIHYIVFEGIQARNERLVHRLIRVIVLLIMMLMLTNGTWIYYLLQYDYTDTQSTETTTYTQDGTGNNVIGDGNEVGYEPNSNEDTDNSYTPENENQRS